MKLSWGKEAVDHLGYGVFETIRIRRHNLTVIGLDRHLQRISAGVKKLGLELPSTEQLKQLLKDKLKSFDFPSASDALARIVAGQSGWRIELEAWTPKFPEQGVRLLSVVGQRPMPDLKHSSAIVSVTARSKAESHGADEALLLSESGRVLEGAWSNFFWRSRSGIWSTVIDGVLPGITRSIVLELRKIETVAAPLFNEILPEIDAAFITQATHGVVPVTQIDQHRLVSANSSVWIKELAEQYEKLALSLN